MEKGLDFPENGKRKMENGKSNTTLSKNHENYDRKFCDSIIEI